MCIIHFCCNNFSKSNTLFGSGGNLIFMRFSGGCFWWILFIVASIFIHPIDSARALFFSDSSLCIFAWPIRKAARPGL